MVKLPKPGLIVCVQTHSWRQYRCAYTVIESTLIDILANNKDVVGLRIDNPLLISYAKGKYKNLFVLGMMKDDKYPNYITPTLSHYNECIEAGADAVAVDFRDLKLVQWVFDNDIEEYVWPDVEYVGEVLDLIYDCFPIISSTFCDNQKMFLETMQNVLKAKAISGNLLDRINIEGNINSKNFYNFYKKVRYVTIGRAIHDPNIIIKNLIG